MDPQYALLDRRFKRFTNRGKCICIPQPYFFVVVSGRDQSTIRGKGNRLQDLTEARDALDRAISMHNARAFYEAQLDPAFEHKGRITPHDMNVSIHSMAKQIDNDS